MTRLTRTRSEPKPGIVHLGPGAFFRAFNAVFTHEAMTAAGGDWGIVAVSLKSPSARDALVPQDCVYTSVTLDEDSARDDVIESIVDVLVAPESPESVIEAMADPSIRIVSLTITEKGYGFDPATGGLDVSQPDIAADLSDPNAPKSAVGLINAALEVRRMTGTPPFTVVSCDNLPANGKTTRRVVLDFARRVLPELATWIEAEVPFPSTMVDRITPATTPDDIARLRDRAGYDDPACVSHEVFRQWVIEDTFVTGRPAWEAGGATFVADVAPYEVLKLRCLNGAHSALAYLGSLAGFETVSEAVADPDLAGFCQTLWHYEIVPVVPPPPGEYLAAYCDSLLQRFRNPAIRHRLSQIAMDGSQKLPQRIVAPIEDHASNGRAASGLCLVIAAWMRYVAGRDDGGALFDVHDPLADRLIGQTPEDLLKMREVFPRSLAENPLFRECVLYWHHTLADVGARQAIQRYISDHAAHPPLTGDN